MEYNTEQKVVTVANSDAAMNAEITAQAVDSWVVSHLLLSGANIIILFSRIIETPAL